MRYAEQMDVTHSLYRIVIELGKRARKNEIQHFIRHSSSKECDYAEAESGKHSLYSPISTRERAILSTSETKKRIKSSYLISSHDYFSKAVGSWEYARGETGFKYELSRWSRMVSQNGNDTRTCFSALAAHRVEKATSPLEWILDRLT